MKAWWDKRRGRRDERRGRRWGPIATHRDLVLGWAVISAGAAAVCLLNVMGFTQHGRGEVGVQLILEGSSWLAITLLAWLPWTVLKATARAPWWGRGLGHLVAALAFSVAHVGLFTLFRAVLLGAIGQAYDPWVSIENLPFEVGKDVISYGMFLAAYLLLGRLGRPPAPDQPPPTAMFDVRDGARLVRVRLDDILAVTSAGNYVEFRLRDGRRPMMRGSLAALEAELGPADFVRTHRSWLVNTRAVTGLTPEGSGDYSIALHDLEAPLSRRYPEALKRLRTGGA